MKAQSTVVSTVLLSGIILAIVTATFVWGQPLVQKTTDKIKVDSLTNDLSTIKDKIDHTQQTGSPSVVTLNIKDATFRISQDDNSIIVKTTTLIPVIASYNFVPLDYTELAYETKLTDVNTSFLNTTVVSVPDGYDGGDIHFGNATLGSKDYNITVYNKSSTVYNYACIYEGSDISDMDSQCAEELGTINVEGTNYVVSWIKSDGKEVIISGGEEENVGVLGVDPAGIISGKSLPVSGNQHITLKLSYRKLRDSSGHFYKTFLQCSSGCRTGAGIKKLIIERDRVERTENETNYYIKLHFE